MQHAIDPKIDCVFKARQRGKPQPAHPLPQYLPSPRPERTPSLGRHPQPLQRQRIPQRQTQHRRRQSQRQSRPDLSNRNPVNQLQPTTRAHRLQLDRHLQPATQKRPRLRPTQTHLRHLAISRKSTHSRHRLQPPLQTPRRPRPHFHPTRRHLVIRTEQIQRQPH